MQQMELVTDISFLSSLTNLEILVLNSCKGLTDDSFSVFSMKSNSDDGGNTITQLLPFPNLSELNLKDCTGISDVTFRHLFENPNLRHGLRVLELGGEESNSSKLTQQGVLNYISQMTGLRKLCGIFTLDKKKQSTHMRQMAMERSKLRKEYLRNLEECS